MLLSSMVSHSTISDLLPPSVRVSFLPCLGVREHARVCSFVDYLLFVFVLNVQFVVSYSDFYLSMVNEQIFIGMIALQYLPREVGCCLFNYHLFLFLRTSSCSGNSRLVRGKSRLFKFSVFMTALVLYLGPLCAVLKHFVAIS